MTTFLLLRHGETAFDLPTTRWPGLSGWGADLAPLTETGRQQIRAAVEVIRPYGPVAAISSPMTRCLESSLLLARALELETTVEFDLHEWVPDRAFSWQTGGEVHALYQDFRAHGGEWSQTSMPPWEPMSSVR